MWHVTLFRSASHLLLRLASDQVLGLARRALDMSLLEWSSEFIMSFYFHHRLIFSPFPLAPERRRGVRFLPTIPNEIYFCIFEHIAPPTGCLSPEQLGIFTNLAGVCRFFANFCLPRIFELVVFSGSIFSNDSPGFGNDAVYKTSRESTLCTQIAAKQPLALALAKTVRVCHFTDWELDDTGSWAVRLFVNKYLAGMLHMQNIRKLTFTASFVDAEHWNAIATLGSLEELSFDSCQFLRGPADVEPEKRVRVRVSRLRVVQCDGLCQPVVAIDARYLRVLKFTDSFVDAEDWNAIATLESVEELSFDRCSFPQDPVDIEPQKRVRVKVSRLRVVQCDGLRQPVAAIDARYLRTLAMDFLFLDFVDWLSQSTLTELHVTIWRPFDVTLDSMQQLHAILQAHQSLEALVLFIDCPLSEEDIVRRLFDDPMWNRLPLLRSLTLRAHLLNIDTAVGVCPLSSLSVSHGS